MRKASKRKIRPIKDTWTELFDSEEPVKGSDKTEILIAVHNAARSLTHGEGNKGAWDTLVQAMNVSIILCEKAGNGHIGLTELYRGQNALIEAAERYNECGRLILSAGGQNAINDALALYEQILEAVSKRMYVRACEEVLKRLSVGRAVKIKKGVKTERFALKAA